MESSGHLSSSSKLELSSLSGPSASGPSAHTVPLFLTSLLPPAASADLCIRMHHSACDVLAVPQSLPSPLLFPYSKLAFSRTAPPRMLIRREDHKRPPCCGQFHLHPAWVLWHAPQLSPPGPRHLFPQLSLSPGISEGASPKRMWGSPHWVPPRPAIFTSIQDISEWPAQP